MRSKAKAFLLLISLAAGLAIPARSAIVKLLYLDDIATDSAVIVQGTILSATSAWNASRTRIYTTYRVQASQYVKGNLGDVFEFRELGGTVGNVAMRASGTPEFQAGERVVLMLWSDGTGTRYECLGLGQGALRIRDENGIRMVDHEIPLRPGAYSLASVVTPFSRATSRELNTVLQQLGLAVAQAQAARQQKEAR